MNRGGDLCRLMWKGRCFFLWPEKETPQKRKNRAGLSKNVQQNRKKSALRGSFKQESFAGSLMEPFAVAQRMKNGKTR